jgi:hypothetical protein
MGIFFTMIKRTDVIALMQLNRKFGNRRVVRTIYEYWIGTLKQQYMQLLATQLFPPAIIYKPKSWIDIQIEKYLERFCRNRRIENM